MKRLSQSSIFSSKGKAASSLLSTILSTPSTAGSMNHFVMILLNTLLVVIPCTARIETSHAFRESEILGRVVDHLENFMIAPVDALRRIDQYLQAGGFSDQIEASGRSLILKWLWKELPVHVYFGLEDGTFLYYAPPESIVPPRPVILSREPGFSGYRTDPVPDESVKHWISCIDDNNGVAQNCTLAEGAPYVKCVDNCTLEKCSMKDQPQQQDCSLLPSKKEELACEQAIPWCPQYTIETAQPGEQLGTVPATLFCIDQLGSQAQTPGETLGGNYQELVLFDTCYFLDETTLVNRTLEGDYASCGGNGEHCNPFVGGFRTAEYDPRYRPWYIDSKALQRPAWTEPYIFFGDSAIGITYTVPMYSMENSKRIFKGVFAVDYTLERIRLFLEQYKGSNMRVAVVEAAEPNYVVAISTGSVATMLVEKEDMTTPCQGATKLSECTPARVPIHNLNQNPGDLILKNAFDARAAAGFPTSKLVFFKKSDALGDEAFISQGDIFEQPNTNLKWHVVVVTPLDASPSDSASVGAPAFYIILATALVGFAFCMFLFGSFLRFRKTREVQNADWRFTCAFILGCSMLNLSSLALLGENRDELCMLRMWLFNLLFASALSPLFVKVWRMHTLFHASKSFRRVNVTNMNAMLYTLPIILVELVILMIFSFADPSRAVEELGVPDLHLGLVQTVTCQHETQAFFGTQLTFHSFLVLIGCYLAFETRNLDPRFGEAKQLAFAMYNIAVTGIILILIGRLVEMERSIQLILQAIGVAWGTMFNSAAFVAPKLLELQRQRNKRNRRSSIHYGKKFVVQGNLQVLVDAESAAMSCWIDIDEKYGPSSNRETSLNNQEEVPDSGIEDNNQDEDDLLIAGDGLGDANEIDGIAGNDAGAGAPNDVLIQQWRDGKRYVEDDAVNA